jgi:hypothetical protein
MYLILRNTKAYKKKWNTTMVEPIAGSSGMAIVIIAASLWQHLCDGLVKGAVKGFIQLCKSAKKKTN